MYIEGLFLHGNLHSVTTFKLFWFYLIYHFCSFDKARISLNHLELLVKLVQNPSRFYFISRKYLIFHIKRISAFKTWWKNQKIRNSKLCSLFGLNVFFNVLNFTWKNYQCSKCNPSELGYCVYIEIPLRLSPAPTFRALKNMSAVMLHFLIHICEYRMTWSIDPLNIKL